MENASLSSDDVTTSSPTDADDLMRYIVGIRNVAVKIVYIITGTVGVIDNLFVIVVFALFIKIADKTMNILIVNQSIIDVFASFFTLLTAVVEVEATRMSPDSSYDQFICHIWITRLPLWALLFTSTYGILLTALDRYVAIFYPIWYKNNLKTKKRLVFGAIVFTWIFILTFFMILNIETTEIVSGTCIVGIYSSNVQEKAMTLSTILIAYIVPIVLCVFCYSRIVLKLKYKVTPAVNSAINAAGRNAVITSLMVGCAFVVCWTPILILLCFLFFGGSPDYGGVIYNFSVSMALINSCVNPFLYAAKYREFQDGVRRLKEKMNQNQPQNQVAAVT